MIYHLNTMSLTEKHREHLQNGGSDFQFTALESNLALFTNNSSTWHWHEFVEFAYVIDGALEGQTPTNTYRVGQGDGYFINAGVLHTHRMLGMAATIRVIQFMPSFLGGSNEIYRQFVSPVEKCRALESLRLSPDDPRGRAILEELQRILDLAEGEPTGYTLKIAGRLFLLWELLYEAVAPNLTADAADHTADRVKTMLSFIHENYAESITVDDIAASANISEREAYRSFNQVLGMTPIVYLQRHRIGRVERLLAETDLPITEISLSCGFQNPSYLCKVFREMNGLTPRQFRKQGRASSRT